MRPKSFTITPVSDADGISVSQTPAAGGTQSLTITGALASGGKVVFSSPHRIDITSAGNDSGRTFVVTGKGSGGQPLSESVTGANASVARTVRYFKEVSSVTVNGNTAAAVTVGVSGLASSPPFPLDLQNAETLAVGVVLSGTMTYSVQHTLDDVQDANATITWTSHATLAALTASSDGRYEAIPNAVRAIVTAFTSGTAKFNAVQTR